MRALAASLAAVAVSSSFASAKPRPALTDAAAALLASQPAILLADDNQLLALTPKAKPVPLLQFAPRRLAVIATPGRDGDALLVAIDDEAFRLEGGALVRVAGKIAELPAASPDGKLVASVEEKKKLRVSTATESRVLPYRRDGRWELARPWVSSDGARVLVAVRDYSGAAVDQWSFLRFDVVTGEVEEIALSRHFAPGAIARRVDGNQVAFEMYAQEVDDDGALVLRDTEPAMFDLAQGKLVAAPPSLVPGIASRAGHFALLPGPPRVSPDHGCAVEETRLYTTGRAEPHVLHADASGETVVRLLDVTPDERALVGNVVSLKTCKARGVLIPLAEADASARWQPLALPSRIEVNAVVIAPSGARGAAAATTVPAGTRR